jgi:hypothetical protein
MEGTCRQPMFLMERRTLLLLLLLLLLCIVKKKLPRKLDIDKSTTLLKKIMQYMNLFALKLQQIISFYKQLPHVSIRKVHFAPVLKSFRTTCFNNSGRKFINTRSLKIQCILNNLTFLNLTVPNWRL